MEGTEKERGGEAAREAERNTCKMKKTEHRKKTIECRIRMSKGPGDAKTNMDYQRIKTKILN